MESTSIYKYRVKTHWYVNSEGEQKTYFYPQYKSKLFGWRNMFQCYIYSYEKSTLLPTINFTIYIVGIFSAIGTIVGIGMLIAGMFLGLIFLLSSIITIWITVYFVNKYDTEDLQRFSSVDEAKKFISNRINKINKHINTNKKKIKNENELPNNEVFYLDLKVERTEKLKRIRKRSRWGI